MAGLLTCLWTDLCNQDVTVKPKVVILLLQRVLVILGIASHNVSQERRSRLVTDQPATNTLPDISEETKGKEATLFGTGFLEKATKRLEEEKPLAKVNRAKRHSPAKCHRQDWDPSDLHRFLESSASPRYGGRIPGRQQPYSQKQTSKLQKRGNKNRRK